MSVLSFGLWSSLDAQVGGVQAKERAARCIDEALKLGVDTFDVADVYGGGEAESFLADKLAHLPRDRFVYVSKCFFPTGPAANERGLSRKHIIASVDRTLRRSHLDYVDLYLAHRHDPSTPVEEIVGAFDHLIQAGKVLYWGVSRWNEEQLRLAIEMAATNGPAKPIANQYFYNLLKPDLDSGLGAACRELGIGVMAYSPLAQGVLSGKYAGGHVPADSRAAAGQWRSGMWEFNETSLAKAEILKGIAHSYGLQPATLALAWALRPLYMTSVVLGASSPEQLRQNARALEIDPAHPAMADLERLGRG